MTSLIQRGRLWLASIHKPEKGQCIICGQSTFNTYGGYYVCCPHENPDSLYCGYVLTERLIRESWGEDTDPAQNGYSPFGQEEYDDYHSYIKSFDWEIKAELAKRHAGYRCQGCGHVKDRYDRTDKLHLHHKHYRTLYRERRQDVEVLCESCHKRRHGR